MLGRLPLVGSVVAVTATKDVRATRVILLTAGAEEGVAVLLPPPLRVLAMAVILGGAPSARRPAPRPPLMAYGPMSLRREVEESAMVATETARLPTTSEAAGLREAILGPGLAGATTEVRTTASVLGARTTEVGEAIGAGRDPPATIVGATGTRR